MMSIWATAVLFAADAPAGGPPSIIQFAPFVVILGAAYFLLLRPEQKKRIEHQKLLSGVKNNDRVVTIGGIHGVVTNVLREQDRVTIKVDENNNTKLHVSLSAISKVSRDDAGGGKSE